ncbi:hypothetical protein AKJ16_DCAP17826 [Drosera capensis]
MASEEDRIVKIASTIRVIPNFPKPATAQSTCIEHIRKNKQNLRKTSIIRIYCYSSTTSLRRGGVGLTASSRADRRPLRPLDWA